MSFTTTHAAVQLSELPLKSVTISDSFWSPWIERNRTKALEHQYQRLYDSGRVENLRAAAGWSDAAFSGMFFNDSDIYKWLEAACNALCARYDESLAAKVGELVDVVAAAQQPDGYLNSYFTIAEPDKRWTNLGMMHELYCAGHLFQAAVAHYQATGSSKLVDVSVRFAELIDTLFRKEGRPGAPGHEEIELALIELSRVTGRSELVDLAELFIRRRGTGESVFRDELQNLSTIAGAGYVIDAENYENATVPKFYRAFFLDEEGEYDGRYAQDHAPVTEQETVEGHAVRAMYYYMAVTDLAALREDEELQSTLLTLWENMTQRRMYVTGGIGADRSREGFGGDYELPNETAYAETCASVGSVLWNHKMGLLFGDARFADIAELVLFNGFLSGISLSGDRYFYVNPLESNGEHHRADWFNVSCCPMNASRLLASLGRLIYTAGDNELYVNQFISSTVEYTFPSGAALTLRQETEYPWSPDVEMTVDGVTASGGASAGGASASAGGSSAGAGGASGGGARGAELTLHIRIPSWCRSPELRLNGEKLDILSLKNNRGYVDITRLWLSGDRIELELPMETEHVRAHPSIAENRGRVALRRGPVVFCLEQMDNQERLDALLIDLGSAPNAEFDSELLGGCIVLTGSAVSQEDGAWSTLYRGTGEVKWKRVGYRAIPYHLWDNREAGPMRVWMPANLGQKEVRSDNE